MDEEQAIYFELAPNQCSLHDACIIHGSRPIPASADAVVIPCATFLCNRRSFPQTTSTTRSGSAVARMWAAVSWRLCRHGRRARFTQSEFPYRLSKSLTFWPQVSAAAGGVIPMAFAVAVWDHQEFCQRFSAGDQVKLAKPSGVCTSISVMVSALRAVSRAVSRPCSESTRTPWAP